MPRCTSNRMLTANPIARKNVGTVHLQKSGRCCISTFKKYVEYQHCKCQPHITFAEKHSDTWLVRFRKHIMCWNTNSESVTSVTQRKTNQQQPPSPNHGSQQRYQPKGASCANNDTNASTCFTVAISQQCWQLTHNLELSQAPKWINYSQWVQ